MNFRFEVFAAIKIQTVGIRIKKQCIVLGGCYIMLPAVHLQKLHFAKECIFYAAFYSSSVYTSASQPTSVGVPRKIVG